MATIFNLKPNSTKFQLIDIVKKELEEFQLENIPKEFVNEDSPLKLKLSNPSYWREWLGWYRREWHHSWSHGWCWGVLDKSIENGDVDGNPKYANLAYYAIIISW